MVPCEGGTFENRQGSYECQVCPAGYFCPASPDGVTHGTINPVECPIGSFCPIGSEEPTKCSNGRYATITKLTSSIECFLCPAGKYC
jgi:hypothetical protein